MSNSRLKQWLAPSSPRTWILLLVVVLAVSELTLRSLGYGRFVMTYSSERYGWRYPAHLEYTDAPLPATVRTNDHGFRDRDWGDARADSSQLRVAIVGNSVAWGGGGLDIERRFDRVLEARLQSELKRRGDTRRAQAMNFAIPGYAFEQSARIWEDEVHPFRPDVVLVVILPYDVRPMRAMQDAPRYPFSDWVRRSATRDFVQRKFLGGWGAGVSDDQRAIENSVRADAFAPAHSPLWEAMFRRLEHMQGEIESYGGELVLVSMPVLEDVLGGHGERTAQRVALFAAQHGIAHIDPFDAFRLEMSPLVEELAAQQLKPATIWTRARTARSAPQLEHGDASCFFFHDPDHLSPRGHAVLAELLERELLELGVLD